MIKVLKREYIIVEGKVIGNSYGPEIKYMCHYLLTEERKT